MTTNVNNAGDNPAYRKILEQGCPFCPGGNALTNQEVIAETDLAFAVLAFRPIAKTEHHWVIALRRHIRYTEEMTTAELEDVWRLITKLKESQGIQDGIWMCRDGGTPATGASVHHLHFHFFRAGEGETIELRLGEYKG